MICPGPHWKQRGPYFIFPVAISRRRGYNERKTDRRVHMIIKREFTYSPKGKNRPLHIYLPDDYYASG